MEAPVRMWSATVGAICALTLGSAGGAEAYTYRPRHIIVRCAHMPVCDFSEAEVGKSDFAGAKLSRPVALQSEPVPIVSVQALEPERRAGWSLMEVGLSVALNAQNRPMLIVSRDYGNWVAPGVLESFTVDYPVTDPLSSHRYQVGETLPLDLRVYMSSDQAWIESRDGVSGLAKVWTLPLFFGFGPSEGGGARMAVGVSGAPKNPNVQYFRVEREALLADINSRYAAKPATTPFLFQSDGNVTRALAAAVLSTGLGQ